MSNVRHVNESKLFVVGNARSGTTWLHKILEASGQCLSTNESHIFPVLYDVLERNTSPDERARAVLARFDDRVERSGSVGFTGPHVWVSRDDLIRFLDEATAQDLVGDAAARFVITKVFESFVECHREDPRDFLAEKTPAHLRFADKILEWWPEAKILEIIRDGRDVCASVGHKIETAGWKQSEFAERVERWVAGIRTGARMRELPIARGRWLTVRYEDLIADAPLEIRRIYDFAGLPTDRGTIRRVAGETTIEAMRKRTDEEPNRMIRALRSARGDHVRRGVVGGWRDDLSEADRRTVDELAGDLLEELGYER